MAETYFGIGKLNFFVFLCIYVSVVGVVCAVFYPGYYSMGGDDFKSADTFQTGHPTAPKGLLDTLGAVKDMVATALNVFWAGLTLNLPAEANFPGVVRLFMVTPVLVVFIVILVDLFLDILKAVKLF